MREKTSCIYRIEEIDLGNFSFSNRRGGGWRWAMRKKNFVYILVCVVRLFGLCIYIYYLFFKYEGGSNFKSNTPVLIYYLKCIFIFHSNPGNTIIAILWTPEIFLASIIPWQGKLPVSLYIIKRIYLGSKIYSIFLWELE